MSVAVLSEAQEEMLYATEGEGVSLAAARAVQSANEADPREPWVHLEDGKALAGWGRADEIAYNQMNRQRHKRDFFVNAFDFLTDNGIIGSAGVLREPGAYYEFGCHRARTFRMALTEARKHNLDDMLFYAFDSFEGLPTAAPTAMGARWAPGALKTSQAEFRALIDRHGIYVDRVHLVPGFFDKLPTPADFPPASLVTVDCDLGESAVPVFEFIAPLIREGTIVYVDDWFSGYRGNPLKGIARAFHVFSIHGGWGFQPHMNVGWFGRSFIAYSRS